MFERDAQVNTTPSPPRQPRHPSTAFPTSRGFTKSEVLGHMAPQDRCGRCKGAFLHCPKRLLRVLLGGFRGLGEEAGLLAAAGRLTVSPSA